jgi:hypothetical protein
MSKRITNKDLLRKLNEMEEEIEKLKDKVNQQILIVPYPYIPAPQPVYPQLPYIITTSYTVSEPSGDTVSIV